MCRHAFLVPEYLPSKSPIAAFCQGWVSKKCFVSTALVSQSKEAMRDLSWYLVDRLFGMLLAALEFWCGYFHLQDADQAQSAPCPCLDHWSLLEVYDPTFLPMARCFQPWEASRLAITSRWSLFRNVASRSAPRNWYPCSWRLSNASIWPLLPGKSMVTIWASLSKLLKTSKLLNAINRTAPLEHLTWLLKLNHSICMPQYTYSPCAMLDLRVATLEKTSTHSLHCDQDHCKGSCQSIGGRFSFSSSLFALEKCLHPKKPCMTHPQSV